MSMDNEVAALHRIGEYAAKVRGHELGEWRSGEGFEIASCIRCRKQLRVYPSLIQPEMEGAILEKQCTAGIRAA